VSLIRIVRTAVLGGLCLCALAGPALAGVVAQIDQSRQRMRVYIARALTYEWPVSTARRGYVTPNGSYRIGLMAPMWRSRKYHGAPMPHAMFFRGGYAIHETYATDISGAGRATAASASVPATRARSTAWLGRRAARAW